MRTAAYTKISQDAAGERAGVTRQLEDCLAFADRLGWDGGCGGSGPNVLC